MSDDSLGHSTKARFPRKRWHYGITQQKFKSFSTIPPLFQLPSLDEQAVLEGKPANIIVAELLLDYLDRDEKMEYTVPTYDSDNVKSRFLMIDDQLWSWFKALKTLQGRLLGRILEQLLRICLGM